MARRMGQPAKSRARGDGTRRAPTGVPAHRSERASANKMLTDTSVGRRVRLAPPDM